MAARIYSLGYRVCRFYRHRQLPSLSIRRTRQGLQMAGGRQMDTVPKKWGSASDEPASDRRCCQRFNVWRRRTW
jgi:hypothetical protein